MQSEAAKSLLDQVESERTIQISIDSLSRGIDNYHIDIRLSRRFSSDVKKITRLLVSQLAVPKPKNWDNSKLFESLRDKYLDLMTVLIHRVKTDFKEDEICLLQFATIKQILIQSRAVLDEEIRRVNSKLAENRNKGSSEALATQQRLFWLKKNYDAILYAVNRQIFSQIQRVEERQLAPIREQFLGEKYRFAVDIILNPLLYTSELSALTLLLNEYCMWNWNGENSGFIEINQKVEELLDKRLKQLPVAPLKNEAGNGEVQSEIHDELNGLFRTQPFLGKAIDTKNTISENFDWFEIPENVEHLFNARKHAERLKEIRKQEGIGAWCVPGVKSASLTISCMVSRRC